MANLGGTPTIDSGPPFADWREQLRERVKEIRARKMAAARQAEAPIERAAMPPAEATPSESAFQEPAIETMPQPRPPSLTDVVTPVDVATEQLRSYGPPVDEVEATLGQESALAQEPKLPPAEDVPLFQAETTVFEDTPTPAPEVPESAVEPPVWARADDATDEVIETAQPAPPLPDLDAIPAEMKDVEIPAWALPRQSSETLDPVAEPEESTREETIASHPDDFMLIGEFSSAPTQARGRTPANRTPEPPLPEPGEADSDPPAAEILDVPAVQSDFGLEPETTELEPNTEGRLFPGLFDPAETDESSPENGSLQQPDPEETAGAIAALGIEPEPETAPGPEPEGLEWDLDAPTDPDTILDAQHDPNLDPSAPVFDRVFSAVADALVLLTIGVLLSVAGASAAGTAVLPFVQAAPVPFAGAWLVFAFAYGIFFVGTSGQTLGKMAMRVRVIGSENFQVGYPKAAARAIWYTLAALPAFLGFLPALRDPEHRALHDRLSGTRVVKA